MRLGLLNKGNEAALRPFLATEIPSHYLLCDKESCRGEVLYSYFHSLDGVYCSTVKAAYSVTINIFRKKYFLFKSFVKVE